MAPPEMDTSTADLLDQFKSLADHVPKDEAERKQLFELSRKLTFALESPADTIQRPLQLTMARLAADIRLFPTVLAGPESGSSVEALAEKTGTDPLLLRRVMKYLASVWMVREVSDDHYGPSNITKTLSEPGLEAGVYHHHDTCQPAFENLPNFLAEIKYKVPSDILHTAFQGGQKTDLLPWVWLFSKPQNLSKFNMWMTASRVGMQIWLDVFPFENHCQDSKPETPIFVDVGGGVGIQCVNLRKKLPSSVQGRIILQDQPPVVAQALKMDGVEAMAYDFWEPQPIKGARAYYFRNIMHDWPDYKAVLILRQTVTAMTSESVIIIDDMIIADKGAHWRATQLDIAMMTIVAGIERTMSQWKALLDDAGLKIAEVKTYTDDLRDSVIVAVPKDK